MKNLMGIRKDGTQVPITVEYCGKQMCKTEHGEEFEAHVTKYTADGITLTSQFDTALGGTGDGGTIKEFGFERITGW